MTSYTPKNGDRIATIDSVTSIHPMYSICRNGSFYPRDAMLVRVLAT